MIDELTLTHFKCFEHQVIPLGSLTLLAGLNGMGKSSVIQSLLLLRQSALDGMLPGQGLMLNGSILRLGTARDVLYEHAQTDDIAFCLCARGAVYDWRFHSDSPGNDLLALVQGPESLPDLPIFGTSFQYLGAERIGPRDLYETSDYHVYNRRDIRSDGAYGVAYLDAHGEHPVAEHLRHPGAQASGLRTQLDAWLGEISPGVHLETRRLNEVNRASLSFEFVTERARSRPYRPPGVGFGISYTLPVLLALLGAQEHSLVLLENPEAHLHPRGQLAMGRLLAHAAAAGVQVVAETHSDHVLNGVRLEIKRGILAPESARVHYFTRAAEDIRTVHRVFSPRIDRNGRIDEWPEGFFDQWDLALDELLSP
jgi:predicted ATPase